jgi:hypothetical protein
VKGFAASSQGCRISLVKDYAGRAASLTGVIASIIMKIIALFKLSAYMNISLNNWLRHLPFEMVTSHLNPDADSLSKIPSEAFDVIPG